MKIFSLLLSFGLAIIVGGCATYPRSFVTNVTSDYHGNIIVEKTNIHNETSTSTVPIVPVPATSNSTVNVTPKPQ